MGADGAVLKGEWENLPIMISHSGFWTRSESGWGSRRDSHFVCSASLISSSVRWRMKTGLPRHLMITCIVFYVNCWARRPAGEKEEVKRTFLPSGMAFNSISTLACASTSAEADMLTRKSACRCRCQPLYSLRILPSSIRPIKSFCMQLSIPTLNRCLRPRRG